MPDLRAKPTPTTPPFLLESLPQSLAYGVGDGLANRGGQLTRQSIGFPLKPRDALHASRSDMLSASSVMRPH